MILVVTHRRGFEADTVIDRLRESGAEVVRFNSDCTGDDDGFDLSPHLGDAQILRCDNRHIRLKDARIAWFHQPPPDVRTSNSDSLLAQLRMDSFRAGLEYAFEQITASWLNAPAAVYRAANKIRQLAVAKEIGLEIPATVVTNSAVLLKEFWNEHAGRLIVKNLSTPWYSSPNGTVAAYTKELSPESFGDPKTIQFAPLIYQQHLVRVRDVRVVVVGDQMFSAATSPTSPESYEDIRRIPLSEAIYIPLALPDSIGGKLRLLMKTFELRYASIDFAVTRAGNWYFLDLNATGAFLWVEKLAGLPISASIAKYLIENAK
jgi:glutathione synthase/RimK-type ligase-like ATP-grasp enzyme